jgi:hypothetical protein
MFVNSSILTSNFSSKISTINLFRNVLTYDNFSIYSTTVDEVTTPLVKPYYQIRLNTGEDFIVAYDNQIGVQQYSNGVINYYNPIELKQLIVEQLIPDIYSISSLAFTSPLCNAFTPNSPELICDYPIEEGVYTVPSLNKYQLPFTTTDLCEVPPYWLGVMLVSPLYGGIEPQLEVPNAVYATMIASCYGQESPSIYKTNGGRLAFNSPTINDRTKFSLDLENLGILGVDINSRLINNAYIFSRVEDRIQLLKGIFDIIGQVNLRKGTINVTLNNRELLNQIVFIIRSLRGEVLFTGYQSIEIQLPVDIYPFSIPSKTSLYTPKSVTYYPRYVISVTEMGNLASKELSLSSPSNTVLLLDTNNSMYISIKVN